MTPVRRGPAGAPAAPAPTPTRDGVRAAQTRGFILLTLAEDYGKPLLESEVQAKAAGIGAETEDEDRWRQNVLYLRERGYLTEDREKLRGRTLRLLQITSDGVNLCDGHTTDPGVRFE